MSLTGKASANNVLIGNVQGLNSIHGKSAYELAVIHGFEGTEEEWIASLKGEKGDAYILTEADKEEIADKVAVDNLEESAEKYIDRVIETKDLEVTRTATGSAITIDSAKAPLQQLKLYGKTTQNGTPTPDAPVPLVSVGDSGSFEVGVHNSNILPYPYATTTITRAGVTFTDNGDGSVTLNGTSTDFAVFTLWTNSILQDGEIYSWGIDATGMDMYVQCYDNVQGKTVYLTSKIAWESNRYSDARFFLQTNKQVTFDNLTVYPMLNIGDTLLPYEQPNKQTLTMPYELPSLNEYRDEIDLAKGVRIQRTLKVTANDITNVGIAVYNGYNRFVISSGSFKAKSSTVKSNLFINSPAVLGNNNVDKAISAYQGNYNLYVRYDAITTAEAFLQFLKDNNFECLVILETPIETPLTETELNNYRQLMTNKGTTTVLSEADMELDYYVNKPNAQAIGNLHSIVNADYIKCNKQ